METEIFVWGVWKSTFKKDEEERPNLLSLHTDRAKALEWLLLNAEDNTVLSRIKMENDRVVFSDMSEENVFFVVRAHQVLS
jgi:hypothetical protein